MVIRFRPALVVAAVFLLLGGAGLLYVENEPMRAVQTEAASAAVKNQARLAIPKTNEFCPYYRVQREQVRARQLELLQRMVDSKSSDDESRRQALARILEITEAMDRELKAESLLQAMGISDGVVIFRGKSATIVIADRELDRDKIEDLMQSVAQTLNLETDQVSLISRKPSPAQSR
ncbi:MAG: SpoIIIAH-like family protein [Solirubrobacterales bacterium]